MSEQAAVESLEAEPSPSPTGTAGVIQPAGTYIGIRGRGQETAHRNVRGEKRRRVVWFYPLILLMRRGLGGRQQVGNGRDQNLYKSK